MRRILPLLLMLVLLCGCSQEADSPTHPVSQPLETAPAETVPETTVPETAEAPVPNITVTYEYITDGGMESARITGYAEDRSVVWVHETESVPVGQLARVTDIGQWEDQYRFVDDGTVVALDIQTGTVLWRNTDFRGAPASKDTAFIDEDGTLYICGFFGPDFCSIDSQGNTIQKIDTLDPDYFWAYRLEKADGQIVVHLSGGPEGDMGDPGYLFYVDIE